MKTKLFSFISVLLTLLLLLAACGQTQNPSEGTSGAETTEGVTTGAEVDPVIVASGNTVHFSLIRPDDITEEFFKVYNQVAMKLEMLSDGTVNCETDILLHGESYDMDSYEILFGNCNHPATDEVKNSIGINEWAVRVVGNKIVIFGHNHETLQSAATYFVENLLEKSQNENGETIVSFVGNYTYETNEVMLFREDNPLSGYSIVYRNGDTAAERYAKQIANAIENRIGPVLPVVSDATAETPCEILIGETNRMALPDLKETDYCIKVVDRKLVIGANSAFSLENGMKAFIARYFSRSPYSDVLNFVSDHEDTSFAYYSDQSADLQKGADLRIMSWNVLTELWNDKVPVEVRDEYAAAAVRYYAPDVVGFQEMTTAWYNSFENYAGDEYAFVSRVNEKGTISYNSIFYRKSTVRLVEHGVKNFSVGAATMRLITWALFERISDGERFIVTSTHWDTGDYPDRITKQSAEMATYVNNLYQKYNVSIFCTGDYNRGASTTQFSSFLSSTGFSDAPTVAKKTGSTGKTYHSVLGDAPGSGDAIDHIAISPNTNVLYYTKITDMQVLQASDHCLIFVDVSLSD